MEARRSRPRVHLRVRGVFFRASRAAVALLVACGAWAGAMPADNMSASSFPANFSGLALIDQDGHPFRSAALDGKLLLVNFVYTACSTSCPLQTRALAEVQRALPPATRRATQFVSVSIDPLNDTPSSLKAFAGHMGADLEGWTFVTGKPQDIDTLAGRLRLFGRDGQARRPAAHATGLWLVDGAGRLMQRYSGNPPDVERLVSELRALHAVSASHRRSN